MTDEQPSVADKIGFVVTCIIAAAILGMAVLLIGLEVLARMGVIKIL